MKVLVKDLKVGNTYLLSSNLSQKNYVAKVVSIRKGHLNDMVEFDVKGLGKRNITSGELSRLWVIETQGSQNAHEEFAVKVGEIYIVESIIGKYYDWKGKKVIIKNYKYGTLGIALISNPFDIKYFKPGQISLTDLKGNEKDLVLANSADDLVGRIENILSKE